MPTCKTVLFLCTGNYYRSRFAEMLFNHWIAAQPCGWRAESRGLRLSENNKGFLSPFAAEALRSRSIAADLDCFPTAVTLADVEHADLIIAVKRSEHEPLFEAQFAGVTTPIEYWNIHDIDCAQPKEALPELEQSVWRLLTRLRAEAGEPAIGELPAD
ncbi:arsenate-mycothiol transferase ArsC [Lignipirellula cremea]|uniref:Low molecular weight protein-tyrosine-phosphatase YwlE n=1 Tax=Lignipirellula cremea TaxID=2528010 RepID=A0A518DZL5_9BACT|nr:low molecular weight phosphatase family protein [Lignipirellula cremea]QDU97286.1 Low molecular weight protein-tyrosine-phosphatase YwlE [Lignipirellula cremea]